jgi:hypothetical protein
MRTALFVFSIFHYWKEMHPVAREFAANGWRVHVLIGWSGPTAAAVATECRALGIATSEVPAPLNFGDHLAAAAVAAGEAPQPRQPRFPAFMQPWLHTPRRFVDALRAFRRAAAAKRYARDLLDRVAPDVVFGGPWQAAGSFDNGFAFWCSRRRLPYCCLSFSPYLGEPNNIGGRFSHLADGMAGPSIRSDYDWINKLIARALPRWTRTRDGITIFYWDPLQTLAARLHGLVERNIWQRPSERYDVVFVFSEFSRRMLLDAGYPPGKIVVAGMPLLDAITARFADRDHREALFRSLGLSVDEPFILYNVEPGLEHSYVPAAVHWERFHAHMEVLRNVGLKVVLSLHPLCRKEDYRFAEANPGFKVVDSPSIHELYPYCRLVVSHCCSTNLLAPEFGKPLIILDHAGMTHEGAPRAALFRIPGALYAYSAADLTARLDEAARLPASPASAARPRSACARIRDTVETRFFTVGAAPAALSRPLARVASGEYGSRC